MLVGVLSLLLVGCVCLGCVGYLFLHFGLFLFCFIFDLFVGRY